MEAEGLMPELDDLMDQLDRKYGKSLPPGYNPNLCFMSHLWEPLRHMYRCGMHNLLPIAQHFVTAVPCFARRTYVLPSALLCRHAAMLTEQLPAALLCVLRHPALC
jgi:hypothetical protein